MHSKLDRFLNWIVDIVWATNCGKCHKRLKGTEVLDDPLFHSSPRCKECHDKEVIEIKRKRQAFYDNFIDWSAPDYYGE